VNLALVATVITSVSALVGTVAIGISTGRAAKRNTESSREVETDKLSLASWTALVEAGRKDVLDLRVQRAEDRREYEAKIGACSKQIEELAERLGANEQRHAREKSVLDDRIEALVAWGAEVVAIMSDHGISFPAPPPGVAGYQPPPP
jgi:hypothetical protein